MRFGTVITRSTLTSSSEPPVTVIMWTCEPSADASVRGRSIPGLINTGVQFAICDPSTNAIAGLIARDHGLTAEAAYKEITANLVGNGRLVPAGIVAVNRAQERGYSIS